MDALWRIELLGWLRAVHADRVISRFRTQKAGALLAYLAYFSRRSHPRETLVELLWPEVDPKVGRDRLKTTLASLRRQLEPPGVPPGAVINASRAAIQLNPATCSTDVAQFEAALQAAADNPSPEERLSRLTEAVTLYAGELLPGYFEEWIFPERQRLAEAHQQALQQLIGLREQQGDLSSALQWAYQAVAADPLREEGHEHLIRLLAASGRPEAALRHYREYEHLMEDAVGTAAPDELRSLARELEAVCASPSAVMTPPPLAGTFPPRSPESRPASRDRLAAPTRRLPPRLTRFYGREAELATLEQLLVGERSPHRLVTLTGPGGSGKTRLATEAAVRLQEALGGRVWFVPLLDLASPRLILEKVRDVLGLPSSPTAEPLEQVIECLAASPSLLLLDNFEHLMGEGAAIVGTLLERVEELTLLVTSRQRLGLPGEREFPVLSLPIPGEGSRTKVEHQGAVSSSTFILEPSTLLQCPSVQLFVDRAQTARPDFQVSSRNAAAIVGLCQRLEGLPLALELAAARAGVLTPAQMLARLEQRFELLTSRHPAADPRHTSLRAALDWSYQLLSPELQCFFARLSVFRGGWTLEAAEAVGDEPRALEYLEKLRECSLVETEEMVLGSDARRAMKNEVTLSDAPRSEMRFHMLETLQEYAAEQLIHPLRGYPEQRSALARRHAEYCLSLITEAESKLTGAAQGEWLERLEREQANLRAALAWATEHGEAELGAEMVGRLWHFWMWRGYWGEAREHVAALLGLPAIAARTTARVRVLNVAGCLALLHGEMATGRAYFDECLAINRERGDPRAIGGSLARLGELLFGQGEWEAARPVLEESLAIWQKLGDKPGIAWTLNCLGSLARTTGEIEAARSLVEQSLQISRELDEQRGMAWSLAQLAGFAIADRDFAAARSLLEEALTLRRRLGVKPAVAWTLVEMGQLVLREGDLEAARSFVEEGLTLHRELQNRHGIAAALHHLGQITLLEGDHRAARSLQEESLAIRRSLGVRSSIGESLIHLGQVVLFQDELATARSLFEEGLIVLREAGDRHGTAAALRHLGQAALSAGDFGAARSFYEESLAEFQAGSRRGEVGHITDLETVALFRHDDRAVRALLARTAALLRDQGDRWDISGALNEMAGVALSHGDDRAARALLAESAMIRLALDDQEGIAQCLESLARIAVGSGHSERAVRLFGAAATLRRATSAMPPLIEPPQHAELLIGLRSALGEAAFTAAWDAGQSLTGEAAVAEALGGAVHGSTPVRQKSAPGVKPPSGDRGSLPQRDLTDREWERIAPLLPSSTGRRGRQFEDHRRVINGILWVLRTGAAWRDLPPRYGSWHTCHDRYRRWQQDGLWDRIVSTLPATACPADS